MTKYAAVIVALIITIDALSAFSPLTSFKQSRPYGISRPKSKANNPLQLGSNSSPIEMIQSRSDEFASTFTKLLVQSTLIFGIMSVPYQPSALASTAPAAQAMAAAEASGKSIEEMMPEEAPKVTKRSSARAVKVGQRLKALNAKMYGAFWCSHCNNQKQELGVEVAKQFDYIECDKDGANTQYKLCRSTKITGYPTWEIKGELYPGEKDLGELENLLSSIEKETIAATASR
jgi:hypothetical protein